MGNSSTSSDQTDYPHLHQNYLIQRFEFHIVKNLNIVQQTQTLDTIIIYPPWLIILVTFDPKICKQQLVWGLIKIFSRKITQDHLTHCVK